MTRITISQGQITIGTKGYGTGGYAAIAEGTRIAIVHKNNTKDRIFDSEVNQVRLNNVLYASVALFCIAFNSLCAGALDSDVASILSEISDLKNNTSYPENLISIVLTPNAATPFTDKARPGSVILSTPAANTGVIYVGLSNVNDTKFALEADKSIAIELNDLSKIHVKNSVAGEKVHVIGSYKSA